MKKLTLNRWLKALEIAKIIFEAEGYFTDYLEQIEDYIKGGDSNDTINSRASLRQTSDKKKLSLPSNSQ